MSGLSYVQLVSAKSFFFLWLEITAWPKQKELKKKRAGWEFERVYFNRQIDQQMSIGDRKRSGLSHGWSKHCFSPLFFVI